MSWVVEEWKEGLSTRVLHKIQELESQLEKLKKERQQRQFQLESLEAALQKQKQKVDDEKNEGATLKREKQSLMELCDNLEKTRQKLSHDLQVKESQVNFQEGQLLSCNKHIERLEQELKRIKSEVERSQQTLVSGDASFSGTPQKNFTVPALPSHNDTKFEELQVKYNKEVEERKRLETELKNMKSQKTNPLHPQSTMSRREIARQQASSSVFSWQQEKIPCCSSSSNQETPTSSRLIASHFPWELEATPSHKDQKAAKRDFSEGVSGCCRDSQFFDQLKIQNQELRSRIQQLEHNLQVHTQEMKVHMSKFQEIQLQLENTKGKLTEKDKALNKSRNEITRITTQLDQTTALLAAKEEKTKRLSDELNCQRQNSESTRRSLEQKVKEKEKEYQEELSLQLNRVKAKLQEELHQAKNSYNVLQAELEKEVKKHNSLLSCQSTQQSQEICRLKEELGVAKQQLQESQHFAEEIKKKYCSQEKELKRLEEKLNEQDNSLTVEKMKRALSDLENQRDSLQQLLKHKENIIEQLTIKVGDVETLPNVLAECEGLKKDIQILSQQKEESERLLNKLDLEKGELKSKIDSLEGALLTEQIKSNERVRTVEAEKENLSGEIKNLKRVVEDKSAELETQRIVYQELQQKTATTEEKHRKETENNSLKLSEFMKQVDLLQQKLQSAANKVLEKEKCISSLETLLASHEQRNARIQKQCEEQIQAREEMERALAKAEQRHEDFVREAEQKMCTLKDAVSEKEDLAMKALAALGEKDEKLRVLTGELERQQGENEDFLIKNKLLEDSVCELKVVSQIATMERLNDENSILKSAIDTLEQKNLHLMQTNLHLSSSLKDRGENTLELSERHKENTLLVPDMEEELRRKCRLLEAKIEELEGALKEQACHFEKLQCKLISLEEENGILHQQLKKMQLTPTEAESASIQNIVSAELDGLRQEMVEQNKMPQHSDLWPKEKEQLIKEMKTRNVHSTSDLTLDGASLEQLRASVKEKEDELNKYQVKLELLQMDLEDKEVSMENYAEQVERLEAVLRTMEIKMEESEMEKERLIGELQAVKDQENSTSEITEGGWDEQSSAHFIAVIKDNFNQQMDAKRLSGPHDLMPSQNDYVRLVSSLHLTMSKLNELEKMCEHLQIEKSALASQLKGSQLEFVTTTGTMREELMNKINVVEEERAAFSAELMDQNEAETQCDRCAGFKGLKLSSKEIKVHFDGVKEKMFTLEKECNLLHEQNWRMASKITELQCCVERLKEENLTLSTSLNQTVTTCCSPSNKISEVSSSNKQANLESLSSEQHSAVAEPHDPCPCEWAHSTEHGCVVPKKCDLNNRIEQHLLCETYEKSFKILEESFESCKNLEDNEIRKIQELLLSARQEVDSLRKQRVSHSKQWQQKLRKVILQVASELPAEKKPPEQNPQESRFPVQGLDLSSQLLLCGDTEHPVQIPAEQTNEPLCRLEMYDLSSENTTDETLPDKVKERTDKENGIEGKRPDCETVIGIKSAERCLPVLVTNSRNANDKLSHLPECFDELFSPVCETSALVMNSLENHSTSQMSQLQIKQAHSINVNPCCDMEEGSNKIDILLKELENLNSKLESKEKELAAKIAACAKLDETVIVLEKEKEDLGEALESATFDNQQLSYEIMTLEIELEKVKSDLEMYKVRLSDTTEALEDLEMTKAEWAEKLLETENELRRIKLERENVEHHALSMEADIEELQSKNERLEKEKENKLKTISGLQEQLCIIAVERNQFSQNLSTLSKDKDDLDQMCQKMQETIKELESGKVDSAEFIRILEAEAKTQAKLLQAANTDTSRLLAEKDCLMQQLRHLEKVAGDLVLEKEMAQSQIEQMSEEKEVSLREYETLHSKLSISEMEISKISRSLEGSLIEKGELAARLNSAQEEVDQMRRGIEQLKIKIESDERKRRHLTEKLKESARKADSLVDKIESLERELQMSEENFEDAIIQAEAAKAETETANAEMDKMRVSLQRLETEMNVLKREKEALEGELRQKQGKIASLEDSNSAFVKQLEEREEEEVQTKCKYETALLKMQSQLKQAFEEIQDSHNEENVWKAKEEALVNEVASLKCDNIQLVHHLQEAQNKSSKTEQLMEALVQVLQDVKQELDANDYLLKQLLKDETLQAFLEDSRVSSEHPEEKSEASASEKCAMAGNLKLILQLKQGADSFHHKLQQWMKYCKALKKEKELMAKQISELKTQLKMADPSSAQDVATKAIMLELDELRGSVEEKTAEADQNLEKYCALIIKYYKLEEENEMLKTQVSLLNAQLKQLSDASSSLRQSPGTPMRMTDGLLMEESLSEGITAQGQKCQGNRSCDKEAQCPLPEVISEKMKVPTFQQHSPVSQDPAEYESDGSPNMEKKGFPGILPQSSGSWISCRTDSVPRMNSHLASQNPRALPSSDKVQIIATEDFPENLKATAEGSKLQKKNDAQLQETLSTSLPLGFSPRSPFSAHNQSAQATTERSMECLDAIKTRHSLNTEEKNLDEACHVQ
ncbi:centromere protein F [Tiliqua scincoides]|uniref:centromere protein F n=1 Tax=Tiliqua scincoides TaxID=71010 RepID=UPI00346208E7